MNTNWKGGSVLSIGCRWLAWLPLLFVVGCGSSNPPAAGNSDTTAPKVLLIKADLQKIEVQFDEPISAASLSLASFLVVDGGGEAIANNGEFRIVDNRIFFLTGQDFVVGQNYNVTLSGLTDQAGNAIVSVTLTVTPSVDTGASAGANGVDNLVPVVTSRTPGIGASGIAVNQIISVSFSETMDCSTIENTFTVFGLHGGQVVCTGNTAVYQPPRALQADTRYTVAVVDVADLAGNKINNISWSFTTAAVSSGGTGGGNAGGGSTGGSNNGGSAGGGTTAPPVKPADPTTPGVGTGRTYYVATNGNDAADGSLATPFLTLKKAVNSVSPGDVIEMRAGSYAGSLIGPSSAGLANAWITLRPYKNEKVILDGGRSETLYFYIGDTNADAGTSTPMYWRVEGLEIIGGSRYAVQIENPNVVLINNDLHSAPNDIIKVNNKADNVVIANNKIHDNLGWSALAAQNPPNSQTLAVRPANAQGIDCVSVDNLWVVNNHVYNIPSIGIYCKGNARNALIENNLVENVYAEGIMLGQQTDAILLTDGPYETYDGVIRNNVIVNTQESCLATASSRDVKIYNNTCYNAASNRHAAIHISNQSEVSDQTFGININVFNNIIIGTGARSVMKIDYRSLVSPAELHMDNNIYWSVDGSSPTLIWKDKLGDTAVPFSEWVARSGVDQNSLALDPLFNNVSGGDYRLTDNSPALDAGANLATDVPKDFANTPRPQGSGWDIGAFESSVGLTVSSGGTTGTGGGAAGGGGSVVADISGLATEMPTAAGKSILRRYPYIQGYTSDLIKVIWGTENAGKATITYRKLSDTQFTTVIAQSIANSRSYVYQKAGLSGLQADTQYVYSLYHDDVLLVKDMTFKTLPDTSANGTSFLVIGDSGTRYSQPRGVRDQMSRKDSTGNFYYPHDFIVGVGDLAYSSNGFIDGTLHKLEDGTPETFDFNFFDLMSGKANVASLDPAEVSILSRRPFFGTLGNHEYGNVASNIPLGFTESFEFPIEPGIPPEDAEHYYSFDVGNAHFVMLDTEKFVPRDPAVLRLPAMLAWLEADLQASTKPWKIAFFHHSIFSSGKHGYAADKRENVDMRKKLSPLFQQYGVKMVMFGHEHASQRSVPLKVDAATGRIVRHADGSIDQTNGVTYVLSGHGGKDHHQRETSPTIPNTAAWDKQVKESGVGHDFTATNPQTGEPVLFDDPRRNEVSGKTDQPEFPLDRWGFVHVVISGNSVRVGSYNRSGEVLDEFTLQ